MTARAWKGIETKKNIFFLNKSYWINELNLYVLWIIFIVICCLFFISVSVFLFSSAYSIRIPNDCYFITWRSINLRLNSTKHTYIRQSHSNNTHQPFASCDNENERKRNVTVNDRNRSQRNGNWATRGRMKKSEAEEWKIIWFQLKLQQRDTFVWTLIDDETFSEKRAYLNARKSQI